GRTHPPEGRRVGARPRSVPGARHRRSPARPASGGMTALLEVRGLIKVYPGVTALDGVDLDVAAGEVHCLVGQNGAGKSTLIKCVAGATTPTAGTIRLDGRDLTAGRPGAALSAGVATIYQELDLVGDLSVAANIFLGHERRVGPLLDRRRMRREASELLGRLGHAALDPEALVGELRPADKQIGSMARALSRDVRLLIMDEPSAILDPPEVDALFEVVHRLTPAGVGVVYISHRLDEIAQIGDRITVLRDGKTVASNLPATTGVDQLIQLMIGRAFRELFPKRNTPRDEVVLRVRGLARPPHLADTPRGSLLLRSFRSLFRAPRGLPDRKLIQGSSVTPRGALLLRSFRSLF